MTSLNNDLIPRWKLAGETAAAQLPDSQRRASLAAFLAESESLAPLLMLQTLQRLGFCDESSWHVASRRQQLRIADCYSELIQHWHQVLEEEGMLECEEDRWSLADCAPAEMRLEQGIDDARHRLRQLMTWLDDAKPLAEALFSQHERIDDWLRAPSLAVQPASLTGLHQLHHHAGIIADYFSGIITSVLPCLLDACHAPRLLTLGARPTPDGLPGAVCVVADPCQTLSDQLPQDAQHDAVLASDLLVQPDAAHRLMELHTWLKAEATLILLENTCEHPLHPATPAAVQALAYETSNARAVSCAEARCQQLLQQAGFELLQVWPQTASPMATCGQRLLVARRCASVPGESVYTGS